jgi:hypothetical protein
MYLRAILHCESRRQSGRADLPQLSLGMTYCRGPCTRASPFVNCDIKLRHRCNPEGRLRGQQLRSLFAQKQVRILVGISNLPPQPGMRNLCCMHFICHALGSFVGETQDETSLNVLVQFLHLLSQSVFHVSSAKFAK